MDRHRKDLIEKALENLTDDELKRFKRQLNAAAVQPEYNKIPIGTLQKADAMDVADNIVKYYGIDYGVRVTARVLEEINQKPLADRLVEAMEGERHFVDRHRKAIIARTSPVEPILNALLQGKVLTPEQNVIIREKKTQQNMMRELFEIVNEWGQANKDQLYKALKANNGPLISDLGGQ